MTAEVLVEAAEVIAGLDVSAAEERGKPKFHPLLNPPWWPPNPPWWPPLP